MKAARFSEFYVFVLIAVFAGAAAFLFVQRRAPSINGTQAMMARGSPIDSIVASYRMETLGFHAPDTMRLDSVDTVELSIQPAKSISDLQAELRKLEGRRGAADSVRVSDRMRARLVGSGFEITPVTSTVQAVVQDEQTRWEWEIKAQEPGRQLLRVALDLLVEVNGLETPRTTESFSHILQVHVTLGEKLADWVSENFWKLLGFLFGGGVVTKLLTFIYEKKESTKTEDEAAPA